MLTDKHTCVHAYMHTYMAYKHSYKRRCVRMHITDIILSDRLQLRRYGFMSTQEHGLVTVRPEHFPGLRAGLMSTMGVGMMHLTLWRGSMRKR